MWAFYVSMYVICLMVCQCVCVFVSIGSNYTCILSIYYIFVQNDLCACIFGYIFVRVPLCIFHRSVVIGLKCFDLWVKNSMSWQLRILFLNKNSRKCLFCWRIFFDTFSIYPVNFSSLGRIAITLYKKQKFMFFFAPPCLWISNPYIKS